jgi:hypothetical protein
MTYFAGIFDMRWMVIAVVVFVYAASKYRTFRRLAAFKGPWSTGWCEAWHSYHLMGTRSHLAYKEVNDRYGEMLFSDKEDVADIAKVPSRGLGQTT